MFSKKRLGMVCAGLIGTTLVGCTCVSRVCSWVKHPFRPAACEIPASVISTPPVYTSPSVQPLSPTPMQAPIVEEEAPYTPPPYPPGVDEAFPPK